MRFSQTGGWTYSASCLYEHREGWSFEVNDSQTKFGDFTVTSDDFHSLSGHILRFWNVLWLITILSNVRGSSVFWKEALARLDYWFCGPLNDLMFKVSKHFEVFCSESLFVSDVWTSRASWSSWSGFVSFRASPAAGAFHRMNHSGVLLLWHRLSGRFHQSRSCCSCLFHRPETHPAPVTASARLVLHGVDPAAGICSRSALFPVGWWGRANGRKATSSLRCWVEVRGQRSGAGQSGSSKLKLESVYGSVWSLHTQQWENFIEQSNNVSNVI